MVGHRKQKTGRPHPSPTLRRPGGGYTAGGREDNLDEVKDQCRLVV
jgi:hypothetical protein